MSFPAHLTSAKRLLVTNGGELTIGKMTSEDLAYAGTLLSTERLVITKLTFSNESSDLITTIGAVKGEIELVAYPSLRSVARWWLDRSKFYEFSWIWLRPGESAQIINNDANYNWEAWVQYGTAPA